MLADQGTAQAVGGGRRAWTAYLLTVALALGSAWLPVRAADPTPTPDPATQRQELEELRQRAAQQRTKIGILDDRQAALATELEALAEELDSLEAGIADAQSRAAEIRITIAGLDEDIAASHARQHAYESAVGQLSRTLYEASHQSGLDRLLSGDLLGYFTQRAYVDRLTGQLRAQIRSLERERKIEEQVLGDLRDERARLEDALDLAADRREKLNQRATAIEQLLDEMAAAEKQIRTEYVAVQVAISETSLTLEQALREQAAIAAKEKAAGSAGAPPPPAPTPDPTAAPSPTASPTAAPSPSPAATPSPGDETSPEPTDGGATPTPEPTDGVATPTPEPIATPSPSATATAAPSATAAPTATPAPAPTSPPGTMTFHGRGTDHGVGLSQWGAYGRAQAGQSHEEILAHYYRNTSLGSLSGAPPSMRVLVADRIAPTSDRPAKVYGWYGPWSIEGRAGPFPSGAYVTMVPSGSSWRAIVRDPSGTVIADFSDAADIMLRPGSDATRLQVWFKPSYYDTYRGSVHLRGRSGVVSAINHVLLEDYLLGVVPAESPSSWPGAALRSQAVAARSYAYVHRRSQANYYYDVHDDARSQVYLGVLYEKASTTAAVHDTAALVVKYGTAVANTLFHSAAGGWTENNENVFVSSTGARLASPVAYLRGVSDRRPDGTSYDSSSSKATWKTATYTLAQLSTIFANDSLTSVGTIQSLDLSNRGVSGRLISVTLRGTLATKTVSGSYFKYVFNVYSPVTDPAMWSTLFDTSPIP